MRKHVNGLGEVYSACQMPAPFIALKAEKEREEK